jgi:DNA-binding CsgD family transcriptional regulator/tetratricopeptide (TPR) repeat protein
VARGQVRDVGGAGAAPIGRTVELDAHARFLDAVEQGPAHLGWSGAPGIGKTVLLDALVEQARARAWTIAVLRPTGVEAEVAHAGLRDLVTELGLEPDTGDGLGDADGAASWLPPPQRRALAVAIAEVEPDPGEDPGSRALALRAATVALLERRAAGCPLLVAIDDLHWLDASSAELLAYAARRARGTIGFAFARRSLDLAPDGPEHLGRPDAVCPLAPLDASAVRRLVHERSSRQLDRSDVERIVELADGNAFVATQLAMAAASGDPLPRSLESTVAARLGRLSEATRRTLELASAAARPTTTLLEAAAPHGSDVAGALAEAEAAEVVVLDGASVAFAHPLLLHGTYGAMSPEERRRAHRSLAPLALDERERARHLALAAVVPDDEVLDAIDEAAASAARRGALPDAAELLELAVSLAPHGEASLERCVDAAAHRLANGDLRRATALLDRAQAEPDRLPPATLARSHALRGQVRQLEGDLAGAIEAFERAIGLAADPALRASAVLSVSFLLTNTGRLGEARQLLEQQPAASPASSPALHAAHEATAVMVRYLTGDAIDWARLDAAMAVHAGGGYEAVPVTSLPRLVGSLLLHMAGRLDEAVQTCEALRSELRERGDEAGLALVDFWVAWIWGGLGRLHELEDLVDEATDRGRAFGAPGRQAAALTASATLAAWRGDVDRCLTDASLAMEALGAGSPPAVWAIAATGLLELGRGDDAAALERFGPLLPVAQAMGLHQGTAAWWTPEVIEALAGQGRAAEARALLDSFDTAALGSMALDARAVALRCAGLVAGAEGDAVEAERLLRAAIVEHEQGAGRLGQARTELHLGALLRRRGQRREAQVVLTAALATFDAAGAASWAGRTREELARVGLAPRSDGAITPAERAVARLVGDGLPNKEIATRLHASPKTVEAHLTRVYRKLGVRTRAELAATVARDPAQFADPDPSR